MKDKTGNRQAHLRAIAAVDEAVRASTVHEAPAAIEKQHRKKKLTIPERLDLLFDKEASRFEVGALAATDVYDEFGRIQSAGVRTVIGSVCGHRIIVIANDSMVKSGTWFPLTIKKMLRAQEIALENRIPLIYLVDSGGLFLPLQHESFPDHDDAGRLFYNNARLSALGIPQLAAVMGPCVAGGAYIPALCDELLMVEGTSGIFLGGPYLVQAAIGEEADQEELGGASTHMRLSGMADYRDPDEPSCLSRLRQIVAQWRHLTPAGFSRQEATDPEVGPEGILDLMPADQNTSYDIRDVLRAIVDRNSFCEYKAEYGQSLVTGTARIDGWVIGLIANQRRICRSGRGEPQIGGVLYSDSAAKAARFVLSCNQQGIPLLFLQNVTGFMVGTQAEQNGIIKDGAKLVNAISNSRVPKITLVMGNSFGAGNYALCGRAFGPRFMLAWPQARIGVMGGEQAARTMLSIEQAKRKQALSSAEEEAILKDIRRRYDTTISSIYAASQLWVDAVIDPRATRATLASLLPLCCRTPLPDGFSVGVFQT